MKGPAEGSVLCIKMRKIHFNGHFQPLNACVSWRYEIPSFDRNFVVKQKCQAFLCTENQKVTLLVMSSSGCCYNIRVSIENSFYKQSFIKRSAKSAATVSNSGFICAPSLLRTIIINSFCWRLSILASSLHRNLQKSTTVLCSMKFNWL